MKFLYSALLMAASMLLAPAFGRAERPDSIRWQAEVGAALGGGVHNPLWTASNHFGFSSIEKNNAWLRMGIFKDIDENQVFSWGAGADLGIAARFESAFVPQQLYGELKYRCLDAMLGAKEISDGFLNQRLSSGALTSGWNARPIPQLRVGIFDYANVWGCKEMFAVKGHIAYGAFDDNWWLNRWVDRQSRYTLNTLYCSRAISFRLGNAAKFPLEGELGLRMETEFGGKTWMPDSKGGGYWEHHPSYLKAWVKAFIPMKGGSDTNWGEQTNVEGNMLGNWSFSLRWASSKGWSVRAYYEHFFEDHSMLTFDYPWKDGLYGIEGKLPKNPFVSEILYEFLYMKDQSGPVYWDHTPSIDHQVSGRDEYYNHYIYNPWQHWGMGIGNPLITSPIYNADHHLNFYSTRVVAHHLGFAGKPSSQVGYRVLASHTRSWGTYSIPFEHVKGNFSFLAEVDYHPAALKGWNFSMAFASDHGSLLGNSTGVRLAISKTGFFKF